MTVAMGCVVDPLTSSVCVTWAGLLTCRPPRRRQGLHHPAVPGTVAATSIATATGGALASVRSVRVSTVLTVPMSSLCSEPRF